jgi:hypothetical protein
VAAIAAHGAAAGQGGAGRGGAGQGAAAAGQGKAGHPKLPMQHACTLSCRDRNANELGNACFLQQVQYAFLAGLGVVLLLIPANRWLAVRIQDASKRMMAAKDRWVTWRGRERRDLQAVGELAWAGYRPRKSMCLLREPAWVFNKPSQCPKRSLPASPSLQSEEGERQCQLPCLRLVADLWVHLAGLSRAGRLPNLNPAEVLPRGIR